jgi:hypothetical protein
MSFWQRLAYFPAAFFGITMGLSGLTLAQKICQPDA